MAESPSEEILTALATHINRTLKFKSVLYGWPASTSKLALPALSIIVKRQRANPLPSRVLSMSGIADHRGDTKYLVGEWEFALQLDAWLKTSAERYDVQEKIDQIFHASNEHVSPVIHARLPKYHDVLASYHLQGFLNPDAASTAISQEWRVIVDVLATCDKISHRENEPVISQTQLSIKVEGI